MTSGVVMPALYEQTWAMPPGRAPKRAAPVICVLAMTPMMTATAGTLEPPFDPRGLASGWTNGGLVLEVKAPARNFASVVHELRKRSGLTWEQVASLCGVDRRSVHLWASGRPMSARHAERLHRIVAILRRADRGLPSATKAWLHAPDSRGRLPLDLLREERFDEILMPSSAAVRAEPARLSEAARRARAPRPPHELIGARYDRVHIEDGKLIAATPLRVSKPK